MRVMYNGSPHETSATSISEVLAEHFEQIPDSGLAVALNATVLPRSKWASTALKAGDQIDVLTAMQGG